ncbi:MAG: GNAT family N-acetyltransferase [Clostridiales bacterium]|nr:GNAT family N-acetyltransferase [Clostridiales bacterium]
MKEKSSRNITIEVVKDGNTEQCRGLCNELMAFQKAQAIIAPELFDAMNYETRLLSTFINSPLNQLIVAKDGDTPVAYVFSTIENVEGGDKSAIPEWAPVKDGEEALGFYPKWDKLPARVGCLNHLYVRDGYRGCGLGAKLLKQAMEWLTSFFDVDTTFVYISNGNGKALDFYLKQGFTFSHDVFGGFIQAAYRIKDR